MTANVPQRSDKHTFDCAALHLCAWDDAVASHVGPIAVDACFTDGAGNVLCAPFSFDHAGRVCGQVFSVEDIRERALAGHATWTPAVSIHPAPEHVLVLWPQDLPDPQLFQPPSNVRDVRVELPTAHIRSVMYVPRAEAELMLDRLACAFYEQACSELSQGKLAAAANSIVAAIDAAPSFPHVYLLAGQIRLRRRPEDKAFAQAMQDLASQVAGHPLAPELAADLLAFEYTGRRLPQTLSDDDIRASAACFERLAGLPWPLRLLDRDRKHWKEIAKGCRRKGHYRVAQAANEVVLALTRQLLRKKPDDTRNHLQLVMALEAVGATSEAADAALFVLKLPAPEPPPSKGQYDFWSGIADAQRILGRIRFLRDASGDPIEPLEQARGLLLLLLNDATPKREAFLLDRIAQCELYLGILRQDRTLIESSVARYGKLIDARTATASVHLFLCDAYIWLRSWPEARRSLMRFANKREPSPVVQKRYRIIAREELLDASATPTMTPQDILNEFIDLCRDYRLAA